MKFLDDIKTAQRWFQTQRLKRKRVVLVPTMGALHAGHLSLIQKARQVAGSKGIVVVSVFVNPTQFGPREDFKKYPRLLKQDQSLCRKAGADAFFHPNSSAMYSPDFSTWVEEKHLSSGLCGKFRPGHFRGVCTVVLKLFNIVEPDAAIFGLKDFQQAQVIRKMTRDLNFSVQIIVAPTVREKSGLALSSRNQYLNAQQRQNASRIRHALVLAKKSVGSKKIQAKSLIQKIKSSLPGFRIDYIAVVDSQTLKPSKIAQKGNCIALAVFLGKVRLIDNIIL